MPRGYGRLAVVHASSRSWSVTSIPCKLLESWRCAESSSVMVRWCHGAVAGAGACHAATPADGTSLSAAAREALQSEFDDMVGRECTLCGDVMVRAIGRPLLAPEDAEGAAEWAI